MEERPYPCLYDWIVEAANGEPIEGVVLGKYGWFEERLPDGALPDTPIDTLLTWEQAIPFLQYRFHDGYGLVGCHPFHVWTNKHVIFCDEYDGSTAWSKVPRNPTADESPEYA